MRMIMAALLILVAGAAAAEEKDCVATPATQPAQSADSTAPGNAATGWSGGLGGSQTGTSPSGAVPTSKTWQPPTARGLDLMAGAEQAAC